jgi:hypothetical protein
MCDKSLIWVNQINRIGALICVKELACLNWYLHFACFFACGPCEQHAKCKELLAYAYLYKFSTL